MKKNVVPNPFCMSRLLSYYLSFFVLVFLFSCDRTERYTFTELALADHNKVAQDSFLLSFEKTNVKADSGLNILVKAPQGRTLRVLSIHPDTLVIEAITPGSTERGMCPLKVTKWGVSCPNKSCTIARRCVLKRYGNIRSCQCLQDNPPTDPEPCGFLCPDSPYYLIK